MGYEEALAGHETRTAFRIAEKQFKRYKEVSVNNRGRNRKKDVHFAPKFELEEVLDFRKMDKNTLCERGVSEHFHMFDSPVYKIEAHPGFFFIPSALSQDQQKLLVQECFTKYLTPPNRTNHDAEHGPIKDLWMAAQRNEYLVSGSSTSLTDPGSTSKDLSAIKEMSDDATEKNPQQEGDNLRGSLKPSYWGMPSNPLSKADESKSAKSLLRKLRWITLGVQFDWSKRGYDPELPFCPFPPSLARLASSLAMPAMGNGDSFKAEAAIVNFYGPDDMLGGHVDDMEMDWSKPIVSLSLGCTGIFLLGGRSREEKPVAMFVRSGDVILMAGRARECFHGVPRIFVGGDNLEVDSPGTVPFFGEYAEFMSNTRVNINVRQVW